jgi:hypothetical protein
MKLNQKYNREQFLTFLDSFLPDFKKDIRDIKVDNLPEVEGAKYLGTAEQIEDLSILEVEHKGVSNKRVGLANDAFKLMKQSAISKALVVFYSSDDDVWRLSLMTMKPEITDKGKVVQSFSNPRRYSYALGPKAKVNTPYKFLIKKGSVSTFEELGKCFSVEVVNKEFYEEISRLYTKLVGGERKTGRQTESFPGLLKLPSKEAQSQESQRFAVRLIGRIIFCWFLREKKSKKGSSLIPPDILSLETLKNKKDYYHKILEPLFFELLNRPAESRKEEFQTKNFEKIPYLNGGLFTPDQEDYYSYDEGKQAINNNTLSVPDEWLQEFFEVLELYNFTVDENTSVDVDLSIDPEMLGRIFENLLAELNPETGESARKNTGSYYTPREIVEYMVDQSLVEHLSAHTDIQREKLEALVSYDELDDLDYPLNKNEKKVVIDVLSDIKVLDPACGSGAFPIGMLQKIVLMLQRIDPNAELWFEKKIEGIQDITLKKSIKERFESESLDYIRKLGVIRDSIFGVDIQPVATEISRLRCFLTLIVEEDVEDKKKNRGIEPLPNLEFKFVTADVLTPPPGNGKNSNILEFDDFEDRFASAVNQFFQPASIQDKLEAQNTIHTLIDSKVEEKTRNIFNYTGTITGERKHSEIQAQGKQKEISKNINESNIWKSYKNIFTSEKVDFFDIRYFFPNAKEGFDIVISNPPYIQLQKKSGKLGKIYKDKGYESFMQTGDVYTLFYERGLELSKKRTGLLCYITSNKWMRAGYGEKLRQYFANKNPLQLLDFGGFKVFESATVDTNILLVQNAKPNDSFSACHFKNDYKRGENIKEYFNKNKIIFQGPTAQPWFIGSPAEVSLKKKIEESGKPLKEWDVKINYGIKTGFNKAFIIDQKKRDELIDQDPKSEEIIKPVLRGRDIKRYSYTWPGLYLITTFPSLKINIEDYPAIKKHLLGFGRDKLEQSGKTLPDGSKSRKKTGNKWFETQDQISYYQEFEKEKIVWPMVSNSQAMFSIIPSSIYLNNKCFFITGQNLRLICAILNSSLAWFYFKSQESNLGDSGLEIRTNGVKNFIFPEIDLSNSMVEKVECLVERLLGSCVLNDRKKIEKDIDKHVYKMYNLNSEEISLIDDKKYGN